MYNGQKYRLCWSRKGNCRTLERNVKCGGYLLATQFVECLKQKYEIEMSLREIFNNAELDRVSKIIEEKIECNKQMIEGEI